MPVDLPSLTWACWTISLAQWYQKGQIWGNTSLRWKHGFEAGVNAIKYFEVYEIPLLLSSLSNLSEYPLMNTSVNILQREISTWNHVSMIFIEQYNISRMRIDLLKTYMSAKNQLWQAQWIGLMSRDPSDEDSQFNVIDVTSTVMLCPSAGRNRREMDGITENHFQMQKGLGIRIREIQMITSAYHLKIKTTRNCLNFPIFVNLDKEYLPTSAKWWSTAGPWNMSLGTKM